MLLEKRKKKKNNCTLFYAAKNNQGNQAMFWLLLKNKDVPAHTKTNKNLFGKRRIQNVKSHTTAHNSGKQLGFLVFGQTTKETVLSKEQIFCWTCFCINLPSICYPAPMQPQVIIFCGRNTWVIGGWGSGPYYIYIYTYYHTHAHILLVGRNAPKAAYKGHPFCQEHWPPSSQAGSVRELAEQWLQAYVAGLDLKKSFWSCPCLAMRLPCFRAPGSPSSCTEKDQIATSAARWPDKPPLSSKRERPNMKMTWDRRALAHHRR